MKTFLGWDGIQLHFKPIPSKIEFVEICLKQ